MAFIESYVVSSPAMRRVSELIAHAASSRAPVLILGERGSGKRRAAREIHVRAGGAGPLETSSCDALQHDTVAPRAPEGRLYLADLAALDFSRRFKVLRTLGDGVIAGLTIAGLDDATRSTVSADELREGIFDGSRVVVVRLPALRDHGEDIVPLADAMLLRIALRRGTGPMSLTPDAACALEAYAWPGNVAELETTLERAAALASGGTIGREHLPALVLAGARPALAGDLATLQYREVLAHARDLLSRDYLVAILRAERGNVKNAASRAGIERESLHRLLKRYGVRADVFRPR